MHTKNNRRKYIVDGKYQLSQVAAVVLSNSMVVALIAALLSWFYLIAWDGSVVVNYNRQIPIYLVICLVIVTLLSIYFSLHRSRSVAGMMKKLHYILENAEKGVFPEQKLVFRKSDYFRQIAVPLNQCLLQLQKNQKQNDGIFIQELEYLIHSIEKGETDISQVRISLQNILKNRKKQGDKPINN